MRTQWLNHRLLERFHSTFIAMTRQVVNLFPFFENFFYIWQPAAISVTISNLRACNFLNSFSDLLTLSCQHPDAIRGHFRKYRDYHKKIVSIRGGFLPIPAALATRHCCGRKLQLPAYRPLCGDCCRHSGSRCSRFAEKNPIQKAAHLHFPGPDSARRGVVWRGADLL